MFGMAMYSMDLHDVSLNQIFIPWLDVEFQCCLMSFRCSGIQLLLIYFSMPEMRGMILLMCAARELHEWMGNLNYCVVVQDVSLFFMPSSENKHKVDVLTPCYWINPWFLNQHLAGGHISVSSLSS